jgi:very-short-patch-repair endonuclease
MTESMAEPKPRLLDQVRELRIRHYSIRTEQAYVQWMRRFIVFHGKRHPSDMGLPEATVSVCCATGQKNRVRSPSCRRIGSGISDICTEADMRNAVAQRRARALRIRMTDAERHLWYHLRRRNLNGCRFRRQVPIGPFIADFASLEQRLVVEIDGSQHCGSQRDRRRDAFLQAKGFRVLRFWDNEVLLQTESVLEVIWRATEMPPSCPSPAKRGKGRSSPGTQ